MYTLLLANCVFRGDPIRADTFSERCINAVVSPFAPIWALHLDFQV